MITWNAHTPINRALITQRFNQYPLNPDNGAGDAKLFFYRNGFSDGVEYHQAVIDRIAKTSSRDVGSLSASLAIKDLRLTMQENEIKRLKRLIQARDRGLEEIETVIGVIVANASPDKISLRLAVDMLKGFNEEFFKKFKKEIP